MEIEIAKEILAQFDRLGLEIPEALNMLTEHYLISDNVVELRDVADADARRCVEFLKGIATP